MLENMQVQDWHLDEYLTKFWESIENISHLVDLWKALDNLLWLVLNPILDEQLEQTVKEYRCSF